MSSKFTELLFDPLLYPQPEQLDCFYMHSFDNVIGCQQESQLETVDSSEFPQVDAIQRDSCFIYRKTDQDRLESVLSEMKPFERVGGILHEPRKCKKFTFLVGRLPNTNLYVRIVKLNRRYQNLIKYTNYYLVHFYTFNENPQNAENRENTENENQPIEPEQKEEVVAPNVKKEDFQSVDSTQSVQKRCLVRELNINKKLKTEEDISSTSPPMPSVCDEYRQKQEHMRQHINKQCNSKDQSPINEQLVLDWVYQQNQLAQLTNSICSLQDTVYSLQDALGKLMAQSASTNLKIDQLTKEMKGLTDEIEELTEENKELKAAIHRKHDI